MPTRRVKPVVSIVLPSYNRHGLVRRTLESIYAQKKTAPPFEVLLIDDGSTDDTQSLRKDFPIRYFYLDRPGWSNPARPLNIGIRQAKADLIILQGGEVIHSDDITIKKLVDSVKNDPGIWVFARVVNFLKGHMGSLMCGSHAARPLWFLSILWRKHLLAINGVDEDFDKAGFDDDDLARRLRDTCGLRFVWRDDIMGLHQDHSRIEQAGMGEMATLNQKKQRLEAEGEITAVRNLDREWGKLDYPEGEHP